MRYIGINLTKDVQNHYEVKYKTLLKGVRQLNRELLCLWIGRLNTGKMSVLSRMTFKSGAIPITIPTGFLSELDELILKCIWTSKGLRTAKRILKNMVGGDLSHRTLRFILRLAELRQSAVPWAQTEANGAEERDGHRPMLGTNT